jgi:hypothetical protein
MFMYYLKHFIESWVGNADDRGRNQAAMDVRARLENIDEERSFTVPEPAKVPPGYVYTTPYALEVGKILVFDLGAMQVDIDGHAWIDPFAINVDPAITKNAVLLEKLEDGTIKVNLSRCHGHSWRRGPKPERKHGLDWIMVSEFVGQVPPGTVLPAK